MAEQPPLPPRPEGWSPRTLLDEHLERQAHFAALIGPERANIPGLVDPHADVECVCGRKEWPGDMQDVTGLDPSILAHLKRYQEQELPTHVCGGCRSRLVREGVVDRYQLAAARGAPPELLGWIWQKMARNPGGVGVPLALKEMVAQGRDPLIAPEATGLVDGLPDEQATRLNAPLGFFDPARGGSDLPL